MPENEFHDFPCTLPRFNRLLVTNAQRITRQIVAHRVPHDADTKIQVLTQESCNVPLLIPTSYQRMQFRSEAMVDFASIQHRGRLSKPLDRCVRDRLVRVFLRGRRCFSAIEDRTFFPLRSGPRSERHALDAWTPTRYILVLTSNEYK